MQRLLFLFVTAFTLSLVLVPLCRLVAVRLGYTAKPKDDRWHRRPTALLGGVAIALTVLGLGLADSQIRGLPVMLAGAAAMFTLGLVDDLFNLKPYTKLIAEIVIASLFVFFGYRLNWTESLTLDTLLTMVWIVGLTNALNLLDNMDGLCAGVALIAGTTLLAAVVLQGGMTPEATYLALLLGATAGFLIYN